MNILPKKRWHVRTKQNIERVRKDEVNARCEEERQKKRARRAEQEARIEYLRKKGGVSSLTADNNVSIAAEDDCAGVSNKDHDAEETARQQKYEMAIGALTFLGQNASRVKPWYLEASGERLFSSKQTKANDFVERPKLPFMDPLHNMKKYLKHKTDMNCKNLPGKDTLSSVKRSCNNMQFKNSSDKAKLTIQQLREKRLLRERIEREKANKLIKQSDPKKLKELRN